MYFISNTHTYTYKSTNIFYNLAACPQTTLLYNAFLNYIIFDLIQFHFIPIKCQIMAFYLSHTYKITHHGHSLDFMTHRGS